MSACECAACKEHFTGQSGFDRHQDVDYARVPAVICRDPAALGMRKNLNDRWGEPADASSRAALPNLRAKATPGVTI